MLPANFWEEFDRRLDAKLEQRFDNFEKKMDEKLEQKLEQKLKPIRTDINAIIKWTQRQDKSMEKELTDALYKHMSHFYREFKTIRPLDFPKHINGGISEITELDGVIILTNNAMYPNKNKSSPNDKLYFVIVEAKQHITYHKLTLKFKQKAKIEELIKSQNEFFKDFEPHVGLYVGGIEIDTKAIDYLKEEIANSPENRFIGWIDLNGNRFTVNDTVSDFGKISIASGGSKKK